MGVVKFSDYQRPQIEAVESRVADLDDGYARLSNMLLEEYAGADLTKRQFKVLLAILRKTYGWSKPMDRISDSQISEIAKLPVKRCNEAKLELVRMGLIKQQGGMFGPNKNVSEWHIPQNRGISLKIGDKTSLKLRESNPSKQGDTKDTITKDKKDNTPNPLTGVVMAGQEKPGKKPKAPPIPYQAVLEAYNEVVGDKLPNAEALNDKRKRSIKRLLSELKEPTVTAAKNYFGAFVTHAKPFYFGQNDTGWQASFDYLLRSDTLLKTREGSL